MNRRLLRRAGLLAVPVALVAALLSVGRGDAAPVVAPAQGAPAPDRVATCLLYAATNSALQTRLVTSNDPRIHTSTLWESLECGTRQVTVPRGRRGLVVVKVDAEVACTGADGHWCLGRVLIGGVAGQPTAPEPDSFAWANSEPNTAQWESNAFTRTRAVVCPSNASLPVCTLTVRVQVRNHVEGLSFWIDDSTVHVQVTYI
jgi:hypothetical protein